jgi:hypothetical protein
MVAPFRIGAGITLGAGIAVGHTSSGPSTVLNFSEFGTPNSGDIEDGAGSFSGTGFTIHTLGKSGIAMPSLSPGNVSFFGSNAYNSGYIWTVTWAALSTHASTPVALYYDRFGGNTLVFWVLNPSDLTYMTPATGTFNFPATFTEGTTPTSFND